MKKYNKLIINNLKCSFRNNIFIYLLFVVLILLSCIYLKNGVMHEAAGNGCPAEDYPKQPQPFGDRDGGTAARHHGKRGCQFCFFLPQ